jgi:hypothetical protein
VAEASSCLIGLSLVLAKNGRVTIER